ncbi:MAG: lipocalin-like domain-containing protein [Betaproteobacteria bacterium]
MALLGGMLVAPKTLAQVSSRQSPAPPFAPVVSGYALRFPRDEGSHPGFRTEWWYVTGWLDVAGGPLGFQITFFRFQPELKGDNPSAFTPRHILAAHAAISDPARGGLQRDQRVARVGFALAGAGEDRLDVWVDDWSLKQENGVYRARIPARDFRFDFTFPATQPPLLQGNGGLSRKGPRPGSASYYYSRPQLKVQGTLTRDGKAEPAVGTAWLDHEWSSSYLDERAAGWDWLGINLADGGALMAFRMRDEQGGKFWAGGAYRAADGRTRIFEPGEVDFTPLRRWRSSRSGAFYPIAWRITAGSLKIDVTPLMDDQENDTRASTGTIYWEGAVRALQDGQAVGRGYLELTGYWRPLRL